MHFANNMEDDRTDRFFKMRSLSERIRLNCLKIEEEKKMSIDEMMIPYKGTRAGSLRHYMPKKPKKWGIKIFIRAGVSGFVYDFLFYQGQSTFIKHTFPENGNHFGLSAKTVLALSQSIVDKPLSVIYFDKLFFVRLT